MPTDPAALRSELGAMRLILQAMAAIGSTSDPGAAETRVRMAMGVVFVNNPSNRPDWNLSREERAEFQRDWEELQAAVQRIGLALIAEIRKPMHSVN